MSDEQPPTAVDRRAFLGVLIGSLLAACTAETAGPGVPGSSATPESTATPTPTTSATSSSAPEESVEPVEPIPSPDAAVPVDAFGLGVASGEPDDRSVVLWTRLVGALPDEFEMVWELALDDTMTALVATGSVAVSAVDGHSVRVLVAALEPDRTYAYRFRTGQAVSPVGRTRTMPSPDNGRSITLGVSSCQARTDGAWAAHRDMADAPLDAVVWLGDYIYGEHRSLEEYRTAYAEYRSDPLLQACHGAHPWFVFTDDHEVANDYDRSVDPARRAAALRAWWENQPTRLPPPDADGHLATNRAFDLGGAARLIGLDVRQFAEPESLLGEDQWQFVESRSDHDRATTILASPTLMSGVRDLSGDPLLTYSIDTRPRERARLADALDRSPRPMIVSGDLHTSLVADYRVDPLDAAERVVAVELMAPAISSAFPDQLAALAPLLPLVNPQLRTVEVENGWLQLDVGSEAGPNGRSAAFHFVDDVADPHSSITVRPIPDL